ncbi:MAG TPA: Xaa-Pro peptidase family protein [Methanomassiliicoccales archaeon]|nr:Xaa-Pro peptidase family protein [Methanomassiliicoccales archaeon]
MKARIQRIFENVQEDVDAIVIINDIEPNLDVNFFYATGAVSGLFENAAAVLGPEGNVDLICHQLEETSGRATDADLKTYSRKAERDAILRKRLSGMKRIGISGGGLTFRVAEELRKLTDAKLVDVNKGLEMARLVKDEKELDCTREACRIGARVAEELPGLLRDGVKEYELAAEVNFRMQKAGASGPAFATNSSFGPNAAEPHHSPDGNELRKGDAALFDFGALSGRYCSDITRTYFFGSASPKMKRMYAVVQEAQSAAIAVMKSGVNGKDVDEAARKVIDSSEFKGLFIHSLGHSIGLSVHDGGRMAPETDLILRENMVFTVEPGVYVRGKGGVRIEDDVRVTSRGVEVLTQASRDLRVV